MAAEKGSVFAGAGQTERLSLISAQFSNMDAVTHRTQFSNMDASLLMARRQPLAATAPVSHRSRVKPRLRQPRSRQPLPFRRQPVFAAKLRSQAPTGWDPLGGKWAPQDGQVVFVAEHVELGLQYCCGGGSVE
jgi:hypothetical protein